MANPWLGTGIVLAAFFLLMTGLQAWRRWRHPNPELVRKLLHVGMGLVTLSFPWLFVSAWPVLLLAVAFAVGLAAIRLSRSLRHHLGGIIDGVDRQSLGEIYFPIAVALVFLLSGGDPLLFCVPMLILTLADAAAALIGWHYGSHRFGSTEGQKSLEGSLTFYTVAFFSTYIPLLLFPRTAPPGTLLVALTVAFLTTLLEAIAWNGLDNLLIPLGAFIMLQAFLKPELSVLAAVQCASLAVTGLLPRVYRRASHLTPGSSPPHRGLPDTLRISRFRGVGNGAV